MVKGCGKSLCNQRAYVFSAHTEKFSEQHEWREEKMPQKGHVWIMCGNGYDTESRSRYPGEELVWIPLCKECAIGRGYIW
jgi:hypothetical protein